MRNVLFVALFAATLLIPAGAQAQIRGEIIAEGLTAPVAFIHDPLYDNAFFIVEKGGLVKVLVNGAIQATPFIDLRSDVSTGGEQGLLGMAFHPAGDRVFFNFTNTDGHTVVARFRRFPGNPLRADPASRFDLLWPTGARFIAQPFANHNGGHLEFSRWDGYLYIALGDGGSGNDPLNNAQNPASLLGKVLRIDVNVPDTDQKGYRVPADNPFIDGQPIAALPEIWAFGLRNPWRYSFDSVGPGATDALIIGDVGQVDREEIDVEPPGAGGRNYGWRIFEGSARAPDSPDTTPAYQPVTPPLFDYERSEGRAVTGGYVYRGSMLGEAYRGRYFFGDFASSRVWSLGVAVSPAGEPFVTDRVDHTTELGGNLGGVASFGRDRSGELYVLTFAGRIVKIVPASGGVLSSPLNLTASVSAGTVAVSWIPPLSGVFAAYRLEAGSAPGATDLATVAVGADITSLTFVNVAPGTYYARVRAIHGAASSEPSHEIVVVVPTPPCTQQPPAPFALSSVVNGDIVTLAWHASTGPNLATQFVIEAGSASGLANLAVIPVSGAGRALSVQAPAGTYHVRIRAANACGASAASNEIAVTVP